MVNGHGQERLKLGKGAAFVKSHLRRLPECDEVWEADFGPAPRPFAASGMIWQGMVVSHDGGFLAQCMLETPPTVNDLANLLADAMRRPLDEEPRRPHALCIRQRSEWLELLPHLRQLVRQAVAEPRMERWDREFKEFTEYLLRSEEARHRREDEIRSSSRTNPIAHPKPSRRVQIIPWLHGKITRDGKLSEPDIYYILEKWLDRHPEIKRRSRDIRISRGRHTLPDGTRTELVDVTIVFRRDIAGYDATKDVDLYEYYLAEDQGDEP